MVVSPDRGGLHLGGDGVILRVGPPRLTMVVLILGGFVGVGLYGDHDPPACYATQGEETLLNRDADRWVTPASVQKLLLAIVVLHHFGPEYRFTTKVGTTGSRVGDRITGDLVIRPGADPTWNPRFEKESEESPLEKFALGLWKEGIRRLEGDVIVDLKAFGGRYYPLSRPLSELSMGWGAPPSPLRIDDGVWRIAVRPGRKVGDPVRVLENHEIRVVNRGVTASSELDGRGSLEIIPWWGIEKILLRGEYPISEPAYELSIASPQPVRDAAKALVAALRGVGIEITGEVKLQQGVVTRESLGEITSLPLREILIPFLKESLNPFAGQIGLALALEIQGKGRLDGAVKVVQETLDEISNGKNADFKIDDLSGLSPYNLVTARSVHRVLQWAQEQDWAPHLLEALPSSGEGTLEAWPRLPQGIKAKTGTLNQAMSLAGFLVMKKGDPVIFACFLSHDPRSRPLLRKELSDEVWGFKAPP